MAPPNNYSRVRIFVPVVSYAGIFRNPRHRRDILVVYNAVYFCGGILLEYDRERPQFQGQSGMLICRTARLGGTDSLLLCLGADDQSVNYRGAR